MSLNPESRVLLTDALRPPPGYRVDIAVGTTYSIDLTALLLAPMSFALFDADQSSEIERVDPIRLLEAVRRHAEHTTVFCQAGGIHVPAAYRPILTFVEDSVLEVAAPSEGAIFHPKVWALRFVDADGSRSHRVVVLSRNLTFDRSWDTALVLEEDAEGTIDAGPAAAFVARLPELGLRPVPQQRRGQIDALAATLAAARLQPPSPFSGGQLLPIGLGSPVWPFPTEGRRVLAISPFVTRGALTRVGGLVPERTLLSRPETLDELGTSALRGWETLVLQRAAEVDPADEERSLGQPAQTTGGFLESHEGLHAKTFVIDVAGGRSTTVTGSANLTDSGWNRNVELVAILDGPTASTGVRAVLDGSDEVPGLMRLTDLHVPSSDEGVPDEMLESSMALEELHQRLAAAGPQLHVAAVSEDQVEATLRFGGSAELPDPVSRALPTAVRTTVWLATLAGAHQQPLAAEVSWTIAPQNVTPFVAVESVVGVGTGRVQRRCVLKASLAGDVEGRQRLAVASLLSSREDVLRYLVFLLGDPGYDALFAQAGGLTGDRFVIEGAGATGPDVALFEPLVRAAGRDVEALARVASLIDEVRGLPEGANLVPDGFDSLWDVVWQVHQEGSRG